MSRRLGKLNRGVRRGAFNCYESVYQCECDWGRRLWCCLSRCFAGWFFYCCKKSSEQQYYIAHISIHINVSDTMLPCPAGYQNENKEGNHRSLLSSERRVLTGKSMAVLPLGKDPPSTTCLIFNHNGKLFAAAAIDGVIHMFGVLIWLRETANEISLQYNVVSASELVRFSLGTPDLPQRMKLQPPHQVALNLKSPIVVLNKRKSKLDRTLFQATACTSPIICKTTRAPSSCDFHYLYV